MIDNPGKESNIRRKGQATIYIIIAIVIVVGIILYFVIKNNLINSAGIPAEFMSVYNYYQECIKLETKNAVDVIESQGGRINAEYIPGSDYAPFSSQLNFLGFPVPYWYYVAGNGIIKEQVPSKGDMEKEMSNFVREGLSSCDFSNFYRQGFEISREIADVKIVINDDSVQVSVNSNLKVSKDRKNAEKSSFSATLDSKLGKFYNLALSIYAKEKRDSFLEDYAIDVLRLNAPVDGTEIQCGPKIWSTQSVMGDIRTGIEQNFATIKFRGGYYVLSNKTREYFVVDQEVDEAVNVMYSKQWPTKIEIHGDGVDNEMMVVNPVGTQAGMGAMGFCYVPYHFVYDLSFPVLIQLYDENEMFQFSVIVVVDKNMPKEGTNGELPYLDTSEEDICSKKTQEVTINLYDVNLNKVDGNVSFECFDQTCRLGESKDGVFRGLAPACYNGYINVRAGGYTNKKQLMSTNRESMADVVLDREYELNVSSLLDGSKVDKMTIISFVKSDGKSASVALPQQDTIKLSEGNYDVTAYVYGNSSIVILASTKSQCVNAPKDGLLGLFGGTKEKCFDVNIPETKIESALIGGGKISTYILESDLQKGKLVVNMESLPTPKNLDELGSNFNLFETRRLDLNFG